MQPSSIKYFGDMERLLCRAGVAYFVSNLTTGDYEANPVATRLHCLSVSKPLSLSDIMSVVHPDDRSSLEQFWCDGDEQDADQACHYRVFSADGRVRHLCLTKLTEQTREGQPIALGIVQEPNRLEAVAQLNDARLLNFATAGNQWFWETDAQHRSIFVSPQFEDMFGIPAEEILGRSQRSFAVRQHETRNWTRHLADLEARRPFNNFAYWLHAKEQGTDYLVTISGVPVFDENGEFTGYRGVGRDGSEDRLRLDRLEFFDQHDSLTGLLNRKAFEHKVRFVSVGRSDEQAYMILFDLDRFKYVNDNFGHARGDLLLIAVARRLSEWLPPSVHIARLAGDEFAASLTYEGTVEEVGLLVEAALEKLAEPYELDGILVHVRGSAGFTKQRGADVDQALLEADVALNMAKHQGGSSVEFFDEKKKLAADRRKSLERELRAALERDELSLVYQPQLCLKTGDVIGAEALLRWHAGTAQEVSPMEFVPLAEDIGLMPEIGLWVLRQAIRQQRAWMDQGLHGITVAINVSATQFVLGDISLSLKELLEKEQVPASSIELEITESVFMKDPEMVANIMRNVRQLGTNMALDDFGTGFSSLSYLRTFPVDRLKIDRSFINPINTEPSAKAIVEGVVSLAHSLGLEVVAEGVEVEEHIHMLKKLGCQTAQGYFYSKPLPVAAFHTFVQQHRERHKKGQPV